MINEQYSYCLLYSMNKPSKQNKTQRHIYTQWKEKKFDHSPFIGWSKEITNEN